MMLNVYNELAFFYFLDMCGFFRMLICPATFTLGKESSLPLYIRSAIYHLVIMGLEFMWYTSEFYLVDL